MNAHNTVSVWIDGLKAGDESAARKVWELYFDQLVGFARKKLRGSQRRASDEEDVALSAFGSFFRSVKGGRFRRLDNRHDLWQVLLMITERKAWKLRRREQAQKRGCGAVLSLGTNDASSGSIGNGLDQIPACEPTADLAVQAAEELEHLLNLLKDDELRIIAICKMEGSTNREIASRLGCAEKTIQRKHVLIRKTWESQLPSWSPLLDRASPMCRLRSCRA